MYDFEAAGKFYASYVERTSIARRVLGRPLTFSEKILYAHLYDHGALRPMVRGRDYVEFAPDRVAMQDATAQMALLQFMNAGLDRSAVAASVHCDHLIEARDGAAADLGRAMETNREVYDFLQSVSRRYGIAFWKPGAGIIHQVILENYAMPAGMMTGADSHTPNAGGLAMLAIGVGGADVVDVMAGMGWELRMPELIGVRLTGRLGAWCSAKDVILYLAGTMGVKGGTNAILEYFGDGVSSISATGRATICNMGAELGATSSIFPYDEATARYLEATGRSAVARSADAVAAELAADREVLRRPADHFDRVVEIDLSSLEPYLNGPFSPDAAHTVSQMKAAVAREGYPREVETALVGSCTDSSYEDLGLAAAVARQAMEKGIKPCAKILINPGSSQVLETARRDGIIEELEQAGAVIMANACGPCIGQWDRGGVHGNRPNTILTSFNRNFAKRNDGNPCTHNFVASPQMVMAMAFSGDLGFNPLTDPLRGSDGESVMFDPPSARDLPEGGFSGRGDGCIESEADPLVKIIIDPHSDRLQLVKPFEAWDGRDFERLPLLIKAAGKCTTDHISMAGPWLKYRGHLENISGNLLMGATNAFTGDTNSVLNLLTGDRTRVSIVARAYRDAGPGSIVVAGENYGEGSSREHAAMEPRFLGVRAVLVKSFARIHETNLKKQGVLAITFAYKDDYDRIREDDRISVKGLDGLAAGHDLVVELHHSDGTQESFGAAHTYNELQAAWFRAGSALNCRTHRVF